MVPLMQLVLHVNPTCSVPLDLMVGVLCYCKQKSSSRKHCQMVVLKREVLGLTGTEQVFRLVQGISNNFI